jgi:hypothetical protein
MINGFDLLVVAPNESHGHCSQVTEHSSGTWIRSGGEVQIDNRRGRGIVVAETGIPKASCPNSLLALGFPVASCNSSYECSCRQIAGGNKAAGFCGCATGKLLYQKVILKHIGHDTS